MTTPPTWVAAIKSDYWYQVLVAASSEDKANKILISKVEAEVVRRAEKSLLKNHLTGTDENSPTRTDQEVYAILNELRNPTV